MTKSDNEPTPETAKKSVLLSEKAPNESQFVVSGTTTEQVEDTVLRALYQDNPLPNMCSSG